MKLVLDQGGIVPSRMLVPSEKSCDGHGLVSSLMGCCVILSLLLPFRCAIDADAKTRGHDVR